MLWFYKLEDKYEKYAIRNLTKYIIICYVIGYVLQLGAMFSPAIALLYGDLLTLDVSRILQGQVWRVFSWLFIPPGSVHDIFILVMLYCYYSIGTFVERTWGSFRYNVFIFGGIFLTLIGAIVSYILFIILGFRGDSLLTISQISAGQISTFYISMSIFLAFAMTVPDAEMRFMFVIPIKAKVLGIFYVVILAYQILVGFASNFYIGLAIAITIIFSLLNVFINFIVTRRGFRTPSQYKRNKQYEKNFTRMKKVSRHKCAICGKTEESNPEESFRFCSKCEGNYEYCSTHIYTHQHIKANNTVDFDAFR